MRRDWRIYGAPVGSLPSQPLQNVVFALPVLLLPEEAYVLLEAGTSSCLVFPKKGAARTQRKSGLGALRVAECAVQAGRS